PRLRPRQGGPRADRRTDVPRRHGRRQVQRQELAGVFAVAARDTACARRPDFADARCAFCGAGISAAAVSSSLSGGEYSIFSCAPEARCTSVISVRPIFSTRYWPSSLSPFLTSTTSSPLAR